MEQSEKTLDMIVNLCKNRGYVFPGSEIYGGLANSWDYGPLGVEFKNNVKKAWLKKFVQESPYNVGLDAAIIMSPQTWITTGHVAGFSDPLLDCRACKARHRADKLIGDEHPEVNVDAMSFDEMDAFIAEHEDIVCPVCGKHDFTPIRKFNLMFKTAIGVTEDNAYGKFIFTDTAGLRKRSNITDGLERYMVVRALAAVERSRVALILVDATVGFTEQDSKVAGYAHDQGKACIIVVNKWDAVEGKETNTMELQRRGYAECFSFMGYAPIIFISAQTGYNVNKLMQLIRDVDSQNGARVPTGVLNEMLARATARMQPPSDKGRRLKIFYLTQASTRPPTFVAFVNAKHLFHFSYQRYIINQIRENFGLEHTPIRLVVRERGSGEVGAKDV